MMEHYSIQLAANPEGWRLFMARKADSAFLDFERRVFERDRHTCKFCGFCAQDYQEIINLDGDYRRTTMDNAATACCLCAQCFFIDAIGKGDYGGGSLIYLPDMSQNELNGLCHVLFCAIANGTGFKDQAQTMYQDLRLRTQAVEKTLGEGMSNPGLLGQILVEADLAKREELNQVLFRDVRLLPSMARFHEQIEAWSKAAMQEMVDR